jgi:hypothetical protein
MAEFPPNEESRLLFDIQKVALSQEVLLLMPPAMLHVKNSSTFSKLLALFHTPR